MQKWEYKIIYRARDWEPNKGAFATGYHITGWDVDIVEILPGLGEEGWELVAVTSRSGTYGDQWAGVTDEEVWVFKRPKSD